MISESVPRPRPLTWSGYKTGLMTPPSHLIWAQDWTNNLYCTRSLTATWGRNALVTPRTCPTWVAAVEGALTSWYSVTYFQLHILQLAGQHSLDFRMPIASLIHFSQVWIVVPGGTGLGMRLINSELQVHSKQDRYFRTHITISSTETYRHSPGLLQRPPVGLHPVAHTAAGRGKKKHPAVEGSAKP